MKFFIGKLLLIGLCLSVGSVSAATISAGQWTTPAKIISVAIYDGVTYRIKTETVDGTSSVCASENGAYWWFASDASSKEMYSMVLAAYTAGKKVEITYTDECNVSAKKIRHIIVRDN